MRRKSARSAGRLRAASRHAPPSRPRRRQTPSVRARWVSLKVFPSGQGCRVHPLPSRRVRSRGISATERGRITGPPSTPAERARIAWASPSPQTSSWSGRTFVRTVQEGFSQRKARGCSSGSTALFSRTTASVSGGRVESHHRISSTLPGPDRRMRVSFVPVISRGRTPVIRPLVLSPDPARAAVISRTMELFPRLPVTSTEQG